MSEKWDGKLVMSAPGGPIVEMSLGDLLARKDAEIERLRENVDRAGKEAERADRLRAEIARVKADEKKSRAEIERLREALKGIDALEPDVPDALVADALRGIVMRMGDLARAALEGKP